MKLSLFVLSVLLLSGCTHALHEYHVGDMDNFNPKRAKEITAEAEQFTILGFVRDTDDVNRAYANLESQCLKGRVTGINTRYSTSHSFFSWTNKVKMTGYCVR